MTERELAYVGTGTDAYPNEPRAEVQQCSAIDETGTRCRTLTLHPRCHRHRARTWRREDDE